MVTDLTECIHQQHGLRHDMRGDRRDPQPPHFYDANITRTQLQACIAACKACGDECERHGQMHEHCRICAKACRACKQACNELLATIG